ncbi:MAG: tetratricopeptide repeat protein [Anaerolineae bacterium]|nr:tetratricopeptide repeat protein [Phycisphaerae bacterium]
MTAEQLRAARAVLRWGVRRKFGRGPFAATMLYTILLLPYAGIVNFKWMQQSYVGDHLLYLACAVPLIAIATSMAQRLRDLVTRQRIPIFVGPSAAAIVIVLFLSASMVRARDYQDLESLWTATLVRNPRLVPAHNALGLIAMEKHNNTAAAFSHFKTALDIDEENVDTHMNLARLYDATNQTDLAVGEFYQVLHRSPDQLDAHFGLARILARQGDSRGAIDRYNQALAIQPGHKTTYLNLGQLHEERNELAEAIRCYREAIKLDPRFVNARLNLALLLYRLDQINEALDEMRTITSIDPNNFSAWFNLGTMTSTFADRLTDPEQKRTLYSKAADYYGGATILDPKSAEAICSRGVVLMKHSQLQPREPALLLISEAIASFRRASDLKSDYPQAIQYAQDAEIEREKRQASPDRPAQSIKSSQP